LENNHLNRKKEKRTVTTETPEKERQQTEVKEERTSVQADVEALVLYS
jgi:hypothetical protein